MRYRNPWKWFGSLLCVGFAVLFVAVGLAWWTAPGWLGVGVLLLPKLERPEMD